MSFIDRVVIEVRSGKGGDGAIAFLHEKYIAKGGPSGGNGGRGGSIILRACSKVTTLQNYRYSKVIAAQDGGKGESKNRYGRSAEDVVAELPIGTVVIDEATNQVLYDLRKDGDEFVVAKGGRGGRGNACFKSSRNRAPKVAENGLPGVTKRIVLELKLLADCGIVGLPNAGKSTFLSVVTRANPEIADYPFTTIVPNLGVAEAKDGRSFIIADLPGLIEGAAEGKGLGLRFLRHVERCKVLMHFISMEDGQDQYKNYLTIEEELKKYGQNLAKKPKIFVATKMDEEGAEERLEEFKKKSGIEDIISISALVDNNIDLLLYKIADLIDVENEKVEEVEEVEYKVYDATQTLDKEIFNIRRIKSNTYQIYGESVERTFSLINISTDEGMMKLISYLRKIGVDDRLHEMGAKDGDIVTLCDFEFEYFE